MKKIVFFSILFSICAVNSFAKHCDDSAETKKYPSIGFFKDLDHEYCAAIKERVEILKKLNSTTDQKQRLEAQKNLDENNHWMQELFGEKVLSRVSAVDRGVEDYTSGKKKDKKSASSGEFVIDHALGWEEGSWNLYKSAEGIDIESSKTTGEQKLDKKKKQRFWLVKKWNAKRKLRWIGFVHMFDEGFFQNLSARSSILEKLKDSKTSADQALALKKELSRVDSQIAVTCPECHKLFVDAEEVPAEDFATRKVSEKKKKESFGDGIAPAVNKAFGVDRDENSHVLDDAPDGRKTFSDDGEGQGEWKPIPKGDGYSE